MSTTSFQWDAITWLREEAGLATEVRPADRVEDPDAPLLIQGFLIRPSRAGTYAYASLWVLTFAVLLAMLGMPGISPATEVLLNRAGDVGLVVAAGLMLAAWITSRRNRSPVLAELHPVAAPVTVDAVTSLHQRASGAATWLVAEQAPASEVLAAASELGVRCFARSAGGGFVALPARSSSTTG